MKQKIVIKLGGSSLHMASTLSELADLIRGYRKRRYDVVLVHGGGPAINQELTNRGINWKFIDGQRQTTPEMIDVIDKVLGQDINGMLVSNLRKAHIPAIGLSGASDRILFCTQACNIVHSLINCMRPDFSAIGMKSPGGTNPRCGCIQRIRASIPVICPV